MNHRIPRKPWLPLLVLLGGSTPTRPAAAASPPDGYVVWQSDRLDAREEIYRSRGDGSEVTRLTQTGGLLPLFAPDGRWIAFHDDANTGYLIRPDGSAANKAIRPYLEGRQIPNLFVSSNDSTLTRKPWRPRS